MDGGYKEFYQVAKVAPQSKKKVFKFFNGFSQFFRQDLCLPRSYVPMLHPEKSDDLKYFRIRAKSDNDDKDYAKKSKRGGLKRQKSSCRKLIS